eukprot:TRINITY_DN63156_c0_g2_i1.p1 TRINITY_DN63156_c0_g2~~TRINITY_DN63156_c0_g2_i1.p1  ORF type:complete len:1127 (+),score=536.80 TRINITY_DN63156_c0_g2_i1:404-3784(+)
MWGVMLLSPMFLVWNLSRIWYVLGWYVPPDGKTFVQDETILSKFVDVELYDRFGPYYVHFLIWSDFFAQYCAAATWVFIVFCYNAFNFQVRLVQRHTIESDGSSIDHSLQLPSSLASTSNGTGDRSVSDNAENAVLDDKHEDRDGDRDRSAGTIGAHHHERSSLTDMVIKHQAKVQKHHHDHHRHRQEADDNDHGGSSSDQDEDVARSRNARPSQLSEDAAGNSEEDDDDDGEELARNRTFKVSVADAVNLGKQKVHAHNAPLLFTRVILPLSRTELLVRAMSIRAVAVAGGYQLTSVVIIVIDLFTLSGIQTNFVLAPALTALAVALFIAMSSKLARNLHLLVRHLAGDTDRMVGKSSLVKSGRRGLLDQAGAHDIVVLTDSDESDDGGGSAGHVVDLKAASDDDEDGDNGADAGSGLSQSTSRAAMLHGSASSGGSSTTTNGSRNARARRRSSRPNKRRVMMKRMSVMMPVANRDEVLLLDRRFTWGDSMQLYWGVFIVAAVGISITVVIQAIEVALLLPPCTTINSRPFGASEVEDDECDAPVQVVRMIYFALHQVFLANLPTAIFLASFGYRRVLSSVRVRRFLIGTGLLQFVCGIALQLMDSSTLPVSGVRAARIITFVFYLTNMFVLRVWQNDPRRKNKALAQLLTQQNLRLANKPSHDDGSQDDDRKNKKNRHQNDGDDSPATASTRDIELQAIHEDDSGSDRQSKPRQRKTSVTVPEDEGLNVALVLKAERKNQQMLALEEQREQQRQRRTHKRKTVWLEGDNADQWMDRKFRRVFVRIATWMAIGAFCVGWIEAPAYARTASLPRRLFIIWFVHPLVVEFFLWRIKASETQFFPLQKKHRFNSAVMCHFIVNLVGALYERIFVLALGRFSTQFVAVLIKALMQITIRSTSHVFIYFARLRLLQLRLYVHQSMGDVVKKLFNCLCCICIMSGVGQFFADNDQKLANWVAKHAKERKQLEQQLAHANKRFREQQLAQFDRRAHQAQRKEIVDEAFHHHDVYRVAEFVSHTRFLQFCAEVISIFASHVFVYIALQRYGAGDLGEGVGSENLILASLLLQFSLQICADVCSIFVILYFNESPVHFLWRHTRKEYVRICLVSTVLISIFSTIEMSSLLRTKH